MFNPVARIELENLRYRQARLKDQYRSGKDVTAELRQVEKDIEKVKTDAAEETARLIRREANRTNEQNHPYSNSPEKYYNYLGNGSPGKLYGGKE
jgi:hypothetical protein